MSKVPAGDFHMGSDDNLHKKSVEDYTDLAIIGMDGTEVKINLLLLASWSTLLKKILRDIWNDEQNNKLVLQWLEAFPRCM